MTEHGGRALPTAQEALDALVERDPAAGRLAHVALVTLSGGEPLDTLAAALTQRQVEWFLWHDLAMWWGAERTAKGEVAAALARVLDDLGLDRYAAACRSERTAAVLAAFGEGLDRGAAARARAERESEVHVPDTGAIVWSRRPGPREVAIRWELMDCLELATAGGMLAGSPPRGRRRFVERELTTPRAELVGRTYRDTILTERLASWLEPLGSAADLCERLTGDLVAAFADRGHAGARAVASRLLPDDPRDTVAEVTLLALLAEPVASVEAVVALARRATAGRAGRGGTPHGGTPRGRSGVERRVGVVIASLRSLGLVTAGRQGALALPATARRTLLGAVARPLIWHKRRT